ncbi:MAG: non-canonical purine NTP pyrophosphatase, partial [Syntrophales bacterium]|nr:non-canonical purine NTP pyrophosphatase [Syntrophales bacterium]
MKSLVVASRNMGKVREIKHMLCHLDLNITSLADFPNCPEITEGGETFLENALIKARAVAACTGQWVLADDSGLMVDALGGAPGVRSARYAGEGATDEENNRKLLAELSHVPPESRGASFCCVLVLYDPRGSYRVFEG